MIGWSQLLRCIFVMTICFIFLLWVYVMLSGNDEESRINFINDLLEVDANQLSLPSYHLNKKDYYQSAFGYNLNSYLPNRTELHRLLHHPAESQIEQSYPKLFPLGDLLKRWPSNNTNRNLWKASSAHPTKGKGLYRINYSNETERKLAYILKKKALPFVLYNIPDLDAAANTAFNFDRLLSTFGHQPRIVEQSLSKEFTYYTVKNPALTRKRFPEWEPPQRDISMTFKQFLYEANRAETVSSRNTPEGEYSLYYLIINANEGGRTTWIRSALPMFEPVDSLFMSASEDYRGVNCRFGMKGVIATAHYDGRQNFIAMIRGRKRYVLLPPQECSKLMLLPRGHPSARHTKLHWSDPQELKERPELYYAKATEVVLAMGEMLYLPSYWFHYIISQDASIQCNARSGETSPGQEEIAKCGFKRRREEDREEEEEEVLEAAQRPKGKRQQHRHQDLQEEEQAKEKYSMMRKKKRKGPPLRRRKPIPTDEHEE